MKSEWRTVTLGAVAELLTGFPFKSKDYVGREDGVRLLRGHNIAQGMARWDGAKHWFWDELQGLDEYWLKEGDVVLAMDRPWIEAGLKYASIRETDLPALLVQRVARLRGTADIETAYLRYIIGSEPFTDYVLSIQTGTAIPHISGRQIKAYEFSLPSPDEQKSIARVLGDLDEKIDLLRNMNRTLEEITRAMFRAWFVDFEPIHAKADGAASFSGMPQDLFDALPDSFSTSEIGEIPKCWSIERLENLVAQPITRGLPPKYMKDGGVAVLNQKCVRNREIDLSLARRHDHIDKPLKKKALELLDILVNSTGVGTLGRIAQIYDLTEVTTADSHLSIIRPDSEKIAPLYLGFNITDREEEIEKLGHGSTGQTELSRDKLSKLNVLAPTENVQALFVELVSPIIECKLNNRKSVTTLTTLRDTLIPKLVSGEIEAPNLEELIDGG
jgi:type I restriction enzyme, S subunit